MPDFQQIRLINELLAEFERYEGGDTTEFIRKSQKFMNLLELLVPEINESIADLNAFSAELSVAEVIQARLKNRLTYETKTGLDAAGAPPNAGTASAELAEVWNDPLMANNGLYGWNGAVWIKSAFDQTELIAELVTTTEFGKRYFLDFSTGKTTSLEAAGSVVTSATIYYDQTITEYPSVLTELTIACSAAGTTDIVVASIDTNATTVNLVSKSTVSVEAGVNIISTDISVPEGCIVGVGNSIGIYYNTTTPMSLFYTSSIPTSGTTYLASGGTTIEFSMEFSAQSTLNSSAISQLKQDVIDLNLELGLPAINTGWENLMNTGSALPSSSTWFIALPVPRTGDVDFKFYASVVTTGHLINAQENANGTLTLLSDTTFSVTPGLNIVKLQGVAAGTYLGLKTEINTGFYQGFANPEGIPAFIVAGSVGTESTKTNSSAHRYEMQFEVKATGIYKPVEPYTDIWPNSADTNALLATQGYSRPITYVPPGVYSLTEKPGAGLWGDGEIRINNKQWFIPKLPSDDDLFIGVRAALAEAIGNGNTLTLIADSIGHFAYADSGNDHWFDLVCDFINMGVSNDEPIMTALRPSSTYTPDFYGVTTAGSVNTGTLGPLGESLILTDGASFSFSGDFENVQVFYTQASGAGTINITSNQGLNYSVSAAGADEIDKITAVPGQAVGEATYTVAATGSVEITGLVRLGAPAALTGTGFKRLITHRCAHGSYTFGSFNSQRRASIIKQSQSMGGGITPVIALGINDSINTDVATIQMWVEALLVDLVGGGATEIFGILPMRPTAAWDSVYSRNYDEALGAIAKVYRENNVKVLNLHLHDWAGWGLLQDGLHPSQEGMKVYAQRFIESIIKAAY